MFISEFMHKRYVYILSLMWSQIFVTDIKFYWCWQKLFFSVFSYQDHLLPIICTINFSAFHTNNLSLFAPTTFEIWNTNNSVSVPHHQYAPHSVYPSFTPSTHTHSIAVVNFLIKKVYGDGHGARGKQVNIKLHYELHGIIFNKCGDIVIIRCGRAGGYFSVYCDGLL